MGPYVRKSVSVGPFRFNLSSGGVGVSLGVPGLRIGASPRGNYVHVGRGGLYYRTTLPGTRTTAPRSRSPDAPPIAAEVAMAEIESADAATIVDSDSAELIAEMHILKVGEIAAEFPLKRRRSRPSASDPQSGRQQSSPPCQHRSRIDEYSLVQPGETVNGTDMLSKTASFTVASLLISLASHGATQQEIVAEYVGKQIDPEQLVMTLERTACLGSCPAYRLTITGTGEVEYEGKDLVKVRGIRRGNLRQEEVFKLMNELLRVHFFDTASEYVVRDAVDSHEGKITLVSTIVTDGPSAFLGMRIGKHEKRVRLYDNYPQELGAIPNLIEQAVDIEQWVGSYCERPRSPMGPHLQPGECGR